MPWSKVAPAAGVVIAMALAAATPAAAGPFGGEFTATANFGIGELGVGGLGGLLAPAGDYDLGLGNRYGRIGVSGFNSLWTHGTAGRDAVVMNGHARRFGVAARINLANWDFGPRDHPRKGTMHFYFEGGIGREWIKPGNDTKLTRPDFTLGVGMQQVAHFGGSVVGGAFGLKMLFARDDSTRGAICKGTCGGGGGTDVGVLFTMGFTLGS